MIALLHSVALAFASDGYTGCKPYSFSSSTPEATDKIVYIVRHGEKIANHTFNTTKIDTETGWSYGRPEAVQCLSEKGWARAYNMKSIFGPNPRTGFRTPDALFSADYGEPLECKDRHGWYRTQQTISAVAAGPRKFGGLDLEINNKLGFMPQLCGRKINCTVISRLLQGKTAALEKALEKLPGHIFDKLKAVVARGICGGSCVPYGDHVPGATVESGTCCNQAAATAILDKLMEPGINTILVSWEHVNIQWLAAELGAPKKLVYTTETSTSWPDDDYDKIYALHYSADGKLKMFDPCPTQGFSTPGSATADVLERAEFLGPNKVGTCGEVGAA